MHNDNIVNNVHLMSKVLEVKVTYTSAVPAVLWDVMSMDETSPGLACGGVTGPLHLNFFALLTTFDITWSYNLSFFEGGRDCLPECVVFIFSVAIRV